VGATTIEIFGWVIRDCSTFFRLELIQGILNHAGKLHFARRTPECDSQSRANKPVKFSFLLPKHC
jgi:hypothetical protein